MDKPPRRAPTRHQRVEIGFLEAIRNRNPNHRLTLEALGDLYTRTGQFESGLRVDLELTRRYPDEPVLWYNLGCSRALVGQHEEALAALARSVDLGYSDGDWMSHDRDLVTLHNDPRFAQLVQRAGSARPRA
jgi:predicted Zn-dependent protease